MKLQKSMLFLSGAPRVSTHKKSLAYGPRNHVLGVIEGFKESHWNVDQFILGDHLKGYFSKHQLESFTGGRKSSNLVADTARILANKASRTALKLFWRKNYDLTYERYGLFQNLGQEFKDRGIPWIVETNEVFFQEALQDRNALYLQKKAQTHEAEVYQNCDLVVAITDSLKNNLIEVFNLEPDKIAVIPNGISKYEINNSVTKKDSKEMRITFVGLLTEWIGLQFLFSAIKELDLPIFVDVMGKGPFEEKLKVQVESLGIQDQVVFHGFVERPRLFEIMDKAELGYSGHIPLSTDRFHSPMKLYEYLARGLPVIACEDEDYTNQFKDQGVGFSFEQGNSKALAKCLQEAWDRKDQWQSMGEKAITLMKSSHLWQHRVEQITSLLNKRFEQ